MVINEILWDIDGHFMGFYGILMVINEIFWDIDGNFMGLGIYGNTMEA